MIYNKYLLNGFINYSLLLLIILQTFNLHCQKVNTYIDKKGIMRWTNTNKEVHGFGVNYSAPFAYAYRYAKRNNINIKKAIDNDIYHFKRLNFDLYRVHVWDTQISDTLGNLLKNKHLDTFDYLISKLKKQDINYVITPIAYWGNGWPEPDTRSPGFSYKYGKKKALTNKNAIKAQQNYLTQFLNHINPYTKTSYKDDPNLIAFEISNEPHHKGKASSVTNFIKQLVNSMRKTGTKKPIFYNMSHAIHFTNDYFKGGVQGGTFQWYPTGLLYGKELSGNLLPNVDSYKIPYESTFQKNKGAKLVYEFDAADVGKSYIYPAMARSFRTAGIQLATQFSYDPTFLANTNTEYNSHFMNLPYTPSKALSLKICSEIFHTMPMYKSFGKYPKNTRFDNTFISYKDDLVVYNNGTKYINTNNTIITPKNENLLKEISGYKNSPIVNYTGLGVYFLDQIKDGIWRLEVMPDAIWVKDPFGKNSPKKTVAVINWRKHVMKIKLKKLGHTFTVVPINKGNNFIPKVDKSSFTIYPGTYIISKTDNQQQTWNKNDEFKGGTLSSFYAPKTNVDKTYLKHQPHIEISEKSIPTIKAQIVSNKKIKEVRLIGNNSKQKYFDILMDTVNPYKYEAKLNKLYTKNGFINYNIVVSFKDDSYRTFPTDKEGKIYDWDFYETTPYITKVVSNTTPINLFNAKEDSKNLVQDWRKNSKLVPTNVYNEAEYQIVLDQLYHPDPENLNAKPIYDYSVKHFIIDKVNDRKKALSLKKQLVINGRSLSKSPTKIQIALVLKNGASFGKTITLLPKRKNYYIQLSELKPVKTVTLPRPYPTFLPYFFDHQNTANFNLKNIESLQISIGPGIDKKNKKIGIALTNISLE